MRLHTRAALLLTAVALTCASSAYQRVGARRMVEGEAWCGTGAPCQIRALGAGFPLPYLIDDPQVSVPNAIGIGEDDFRPRAFFVDMLFWLVLAVLVFTGLQKSQQISLTRS